MVGKVPQVVVSRRGQDRLQCGHPWIFRSDVKKTAGTVSGSVVGLRNGQGDFLGQAFYSKESQIALRIITTGEEAIDSAFWRTKLASALCRREGLSPSTTAYRWVHGESDGIPSLVIDRYGDCLSIQTLSRGTDLLKDSFVSLVVELVRPAGILERNDPKVRALEGLPPVKTVLWGDVPRSVQVREEGVVFHANLWDGQKTGLFLDQRENRLAAARYARGRALDVFAYDGGFSMHLSRVCEKVLAVDTSREALARLRANAEANQATNIETIEANAFDLLHDFADRRESFDTVVLDPPAFAKNRASVAQARRGYKEINLRALKLLSPGGHLITSTCSYHITEAEFLALVAAAAADAGARMIVLEKRTQSSDHPILLTMPETHYLKCLVLQKL